MTMQEEEIFYSELMGEDICTLNDDLTIEELEESIGECHAMLLDTLERNDKESAKLWRRMMQRAKMERLNLIKKKGEITES